MRIIAVSPCSGFFAIENLKDNHKFVPVQVGVLPLVRKKGEHAVFCIDDRKD